MSRAVIGKGKSFETKYPTYPEEVAAKVYELEQKWFPEVIENILISKI